MANEDAEIAIPGREEQRVYPFRILEKKGYRFGE